MVAYDESYARSAYAKLPVGATVGSTFSVIGRAWLPLYGISLVLTLAHLPSAYILAKVMGAVVAGTHAGPRVGGAVTIPPMSQDTYVVLGGIYLVQMLVDLYAFGVISDGTARMQQNGRFGLPLALRTGLVRFLPMLVSAVSFYILLVIGFGLLFVPGILVGAVYGLAPALCVIERRGPFNSFSRSAALTRDNRWRCIGVTLLLMVVPIIVGAVIGGGLGVALGPKNKIYTSVLANFFLFPIFYVFPAALACNLRRFKEGGGPATVADVF